MLIDLTDKTVLNQAALFGLLTDLDLVKVAQVEGKAVSDTTLFSYGWSWHCDSASNTDLVLQLAWCSIAAIY